MYARSVTAMLAAILTFGFIATSVEAGPATGLNNLGAPEKSVTRGDLPLCDVCQVVTDDEEENDEGSDMTDLLMMGLDLF